VLNALLKKHIDPVSHPGIQSFRLHIIEENDGLLAHLYSPKPNEFIHILNELKKLMNKIK
jgi:hypothetical protein